MSKRIRLLDCTLRDGGYYNDWDFSIELINKYLESMAALHVDFVEIGFRSLKNEGFKGGCAFCTDDFINSLSIPESLTEKIGVMLNGSELIGSSIDLGDKNKQSITERQHDILRQFFLNKKQSPVSLVRIACHAHEFEDCLPVASWLKNKGYIVGFNLMQIADRSENDIKKLAKMANAFPIDVLYFADSMGSLNPEKIEKLVKIFRKNWKGELGIHTHDNMGLALANTLEAIKHSVTWVDSTVTGMGRGPGNAQTEYLSIAIEEFRPHKIKTTKLFELIREEFKPMQIKFSWGKNPYYYLAGKYGIHPSYIQEMLTDSRYSEEDILAVIKHLKAEGGKKFSRDILEVARYFFTGDSCGTWEPEKEISGREVIILGTGPGVAKHRLSIESYIKQYKPYVIALNTQKSISENLINIRTACHPIRLLADCGEHLQLMQPLVAPVSMLPQDIRDELGNKQLLDFGVSIQSNAFSFQDSSCILPVPLVIAYALAIAASGKANYIMLAGFDGYGADDPRRKEIDHIFDLYKSVCGNIPIVAITPTRYELPVASVYGLGSSK